ncbi:MAG: hypothetical protein QMD71_07035 [bacterium]|nr:hypothetical protein [bacterium]
MLITTPSNAYSLSFAIDTPTELFISYPFIEVRNDSVYFRGSSNVLLLKDGVPISSLNDVCFTSIERIELLCEDASSTYGDCDAVINIITKRGKGGQPYSSIKLIKNPNHIQFELCKGLINQTPTLDFYLAGDLNSGSKFSGNIGHKSRWTNLRLYLDKDFLIKGSVNNLRFSLKRNFWSITQKFNLRSHLLSGHELLLGAEKDIGVFIQDYWELRPLVYVVPSLRYNHVISRIYPKIAIGWIPKFNMIIFGSLTQTQSNLGIRWLESSINLFKNDENNGIEIRLVSPWIYNFRFIGAASLLHLANQGWGDELAIFGEYKKEFRNGDIGIYILGDLASETIRAELKILDAKIFYKLKSTEPSYGLFWEFWD